MTSDLLVVNTNPRQVVQTKLRSPTKLIIKALNTNTESVWIGDKGVAPGAGFVLSPGDIITLEGNINQWFAVTALADQSITWIIT